MEQPAILQGLQRREASATHNQKDNETTLTVQGALEFLTSEALEQSPSLRQQCIDYLQQNEGVRVFSSEEGPLVIEVNKQSEVADTIYKIVENLSEKARKKIDFCLNPDTELGDEALDTFLKTYDSQANTLKLKSEIENKKYLKKLLKNCPNLHHLFIIDSTIKNLPKLPEGLKTLSASGRPGDAQLALQQPSSAARASERAEDAQLGLLEPSSAARASERAEDAQLALPEPSSAARASERAEDAQLELLQGTARASGRLEHGQLELQPYVTHVTQCLNIFLFTENL